MRLATSARALDFNTGGNSTYAHRLYAELEKTGWEVSALRPKYSEMLRRRELQYVIHDGFRLPLMSPRSADLLHYPNDTGALVPSRLPVVATIHGVASLHERGIRSARQEAVWRLRVSRLARIAREVVTVSSSSANDVMRLTGTASTKIHVIPHGIDRDRFNVRDAGDTHILERLGLPRDFVLYLGNIEPRKNLTGLLDAFECMPGVAPPLLIVGRAAWDADAVLARAHSMSNVRVLGQVSQEEVAPLYRRARVFAFPSLYEGFGFPVVEAMACGTPVVCSDRGSLKDVAGDAAMIVDPSNPPEIASAISALWNDGQLRQELCQRGFKNVHRFDWSASVREHQRVFEHAAS